MPTDVKNIKKKNISKKNKARKKKNGSGHKLWSFLKWLVLFVNNYTTRTDSRGPMREYRLFGRKVTFTGFMVIVLGVIFLVVLAANDRSVSAVNESIIITGLPDEFENYRILLISDLAGNDFGQEQSALMRVISNQSYNCVVLAGDLLGESGDPGPFYDLIEQLGTRRPIYFIPGDSDPSPVLKEARDNSSQTLSLNQMVLSDWVLGAIDRGAIYLNSPQVIRKGNSKLWLIPDTFLNLNLTDTMKALKEEMEQETESMLLGINESRALLPFTNYRYNIFSNSVDLISSVSAGDMIVMVSHEVPGDAQIKDSQRAMTEQDLKSYFPSPDLILGGHYCGGEWKIPGIGALFIDAPMLDRYGWFPDQSYVEGQRAVSSAMVYVTPGLSDNEQTILPFRLLNSPKISVITLTGELPASLLD